MRSDTLRPRFAGKSATGTLTSPNVIAPVQNDRIPDADSEATSSSSGTLLPHSREARGQRARQGILRRPLRPECLHLHFAAALLGLDQVHDAVAIFVAVLRRVEPAGE